MLKHPIIDIDVEVQECLWWLFLPSNRHRPLIFDNVDRDYHNKDDSQAYNVKDSLSFRPCTSVRSPLSLWQPYR
ncbi:uncharacterized protein K441DRAFT_138030 [Cenococcum geophilum 1.58]|uniref:uncharacterized protein n=1 Tax=Cenococcum geophilum 1.58 TaxID=794803 RepID=UPI00358EB040|nr:hypothetical protein K441DRAFT_138030 [Cenococcum geophilum 1.58]